MGMAVALALVLDESSGEAAFTETANTDDANKAGDSEDVDAVAKKRPRREHETKTELRSIVEERLLEFVTVLHRPPGVYWTQPPPPLAPDTSAAFETVRDV